MHKVPSGFWLLFKLYFEKKSVTKTFCKRLQTPGGGWMQDSRSKIQDSRFKIRGPSFKIQDSRFKISKKFLNPTPLGSRFKIQDSRFRIPKKFLNPTPLDSRFKIEDLRCQKITTPLDSRLKISNKVQDFKKVVESKCCLLNLKSRPPGFKLFLKS